MRVEAHVVGVRLDLVQGVQVRQVHRERPEPQAFGLDEVVVHCGQAYRPRERGPPGYGGRMPTPAETLEVAGREIRVTNPGKVYFPDAPGGPITKLDLVLYWIEVAHS